MKAISNDTNWQEASVKITIQRESLTLWRLLRLRVGLWIIGGEEA